MENRSRLSIQTPLARREAAEVEVGAEVGADLEVEVRGREAAPTPPQAIQAAPVALEATKKAVSTIFHIIRGVSSLVAQS